MHPEPSPVTPLTARKTWRTVEPLHGMVYFAPEAAESYRRLGLVGQSGYFASRAAPMGAVSPGTVVATFYNFRPTLVRQAMDGVWDRVPPVDVLDARRQAAGDALRRMLGPAADSEDVVAAADLAVEAAVRAGERTEGRPLFAGHADLPWPDAPLERLWHAQSLLREFRGDGHITQLVRHELDGVEALVLHEATGELPAGLLRQTRGWSDDEWVAAAARLRARGWLQASDAGDPPILSDEGLAVRRDIEEATDRLSVYAYEAIGEEGCDTLRTLARPFSRAVVDASGLGT